MDKQTRIIITGAAGFIGSYLAGFLNRKGFENLILVDDFSDEEKKVNYKDKKYSSLVDRIQLFEWLENEKEQIGFFFHLGARTDTTEFDYAVHQELNVDYSISVWNYCTGRNVPLVYASSAATYGGGEHGYEDSHSILDKLKPLNPYGVSKNEFDKWALKQEKTPPSWAGLKFFNVYGPNEYHKARMASVVFHAFRQIRETGEVKLFRSHRNGFEDGKQLRDFVHVDDVAKVCYWLMDHRVENGLYNLGTGRASTFIELVTPIFNVLDLPVNIRFIDMPEDIRDKYQYFTEADMRKLKTAGYRENFMNVEEGVSAYVRDYLTAYRIY